MMKFTCEKALLQSAGELLDAAAAYREGLA